MFDHVCLLLVDRAGVSLADWPNGFTQIKSLKPFSPQGTAALVFTKSSHLIECRGRSVYWM